MLVDHPIYSIQKKNNDGSEQYRLYEIPAFNTRGTTLKEVKESVYKLSHLMTAVTVKVKVRRAVLELKTHGFSAKEALCAFVQMMCQNWFMWLMCRLLLQCATVCSNGGKKCNKLFQFFGLTKVMLFQKNI